jgi:equilibrative nucleoside transporter 1/2/3
MLFVSTLTPTSPTPFFIFALSLGALQSSAGTYLLTSVVAYAAYFGPLAMQSVMSGQAAVAVVVSTVQLITTLFAVRGKIPTLPPTTPGVPPTGNISTGASYFFAIATLGLLVSYIGYKRMTRMRLFKRTVAKFEDRTLSVDHITAEYAPVPADEEVAPVIPNDSVQEDDESDLLAMSTSLNSLRERERELGMTREPSISIEGIGIRDRLNPDADVRSMEEVDPLIQPRGSDFWHVWKLNAMYNVAVALIYVETLVSLCIHP